MPSFPSFFPISCAEDKLKIKRVREKSKNSSLPSAPVLFGPVCVDDEESPVLKGHSNLNPIA